MNKVIIIGNDHVNTLGVIRTFGENGIKPYVFVVSKTHNVSVIKSKYIYKYWICTDEEIALLTIMSVFKEETEKPVIIPTTDLATYKIDEIYDILSKNFIVPNLDGKQGNIIQLMDKYNQYNLVKKQHIKMAKSKLIDICDSKQEFDFPCIMKPVISANGQKDDITICNNIQEYHQALKKLKELNYDKILLQEFIHYDYEVDIGGFSYNGKTSVAGIIKKERIWPQKKGSTTFGVVIPKEKYQDLINQIEKLMNHIHYNGIFDIDCFVYKSDIYINEINFRNGALSYAYGNAKFAYYWYLSNIKKQFCDCPIIADEYYFMDEQADLHNVLDKEISYSTYKKDRKKCKILLGDNPLDKRVAKSMKFHKVLNKLKLNGFINKLEKVCHKDINEDILMCDYNTLKKEPYNKDYKVVLLTLDNYMAVLNLSGRDKEMEKYIISDKIQGIALVKEDRLIGKGFIIFGSCKSDRFFKICDSDRYIIAHLSVEHNFRGKKYQCDLILELIHQIEHLKANSKFYAFVYEYNIPSYKNFMRLGFKKVGEKTIIRFMGKTINKIKLGG